ncbi:hypothetical protein EDC96DRAFT_519660, partial [Choanephora cucurbitarum]
KRRVLLCRYQISGYPFSFTVAFLQAFLFMLPPLPFLFTLFSATVVDTLFLLSILIAMPFLFGNN